MTATDRQRIECRSIAILSDCGIERPHLVGLRRPAKVGGMTAYGAKATPRGQAAKDRSPTHSEWLLWAIASDV
jgi:hypothetical protein